MPNNKIDWSLICSDAELKRLYSTMSLVKMEDHLGVSKETIRNKLASIGVTIRKPGY